MVSGVGDLEWATMWCGWLPMTVSFSGRIFNFSQIQYFACQSPTFGVFPFIFAELFLKSLL
jgi:hypothetical protein